LKTIFSPNYSDSNPYINNVISILNELGIETYDFKDVKAGRVKVSDIEIANLNWYDNFNCRSIAKTLADTIKRIVVITYLKINNVRIFYTFHNKTTHDGYHPAFNRFMRTFLICNSDNVLLLNNRSRNYIENQIGKNKAEKKCFFVGHPLYHDENKVRLKNKEKMVFLFFGAVRPYKNIELLIKAWKKSKIKNAKLIIVGKPISTEYGERIKSLCDSDGSIELILEYVTEKRLASIIALSDIIVAPLQKNSSMNSGTLIKAVCSQKNIIIPSIDMVYDLGLENLFSYNYSDGNDHLVNLEKELNYAADIYLNHQEQYECMTKRLYQIALDIYGDEVITERYRNLYYGTNDKKK